MPPRPGAAGTEVKQPPPGTDKNHKIAALLHSREANGNDPAARSCTAPAGRQEVGRCSKGDFFLFLRLSKGGLISGRIIVGSDQ
jgi:hypothetical protein